jgi:hypothetical protein
MESSISRMLCRSDVDTELRAASLATWLDYPVSSFTQKIRYRKITAPPSLKIMRHPTMPICNSFLIARDVFDLPQGRKILFASVLQRRVVTPA